MVDGTTKIKIVWIVNDRYVNNFITVYHECRKSSLFEIIVVAAPHTAYDFAAGVTADEIYAYLISEGIECVHCWDPNKQAFIDISTFEPDYIFTTTPYDIYLPAPYQSHHLMKIAKLCNITYGVIMVKWTGMYANAGDNPYLSNCWMKFTPDELSSLGLYKQYRPIGNLKLDEYLYYGRDRRTPGKWHLFDDGISRLKVVWKPRWTIVKEDSNLIPYLEDFYNYIHNNQKIDFVLLAHPFLMVNANNKGYGGKFDKIVRAMHELPNFRLEDGSDFLDCVFSADVLIADHSSTLAEFAVTGKPIIYTPTEIELNELGQRIIDASYQAHSFHDIIMILENLIDGIDPLKAQREQHKSSYFFCPPNGLSVAQYLLQILAQDYADLNSRKQYMKFLYVTNQDELLKLETENKAILKNITELEEQMSSMIQNESRLKVLIKDLKSKNDALEITNIELTEKLASPNQEFISLIQSYKHLSLEKDMLLKENADILNSTSWRITFPIRIAGKILRKLFTRTKL